MQADIWKKIKQRTKIWREVILPGALIVGLVVLARLAGILQIYELMIFDDFMRLRPPEPAEQRVVIVGIDEADLNAVGGFPVPDRNLAQLLLMLQDYQPRVIGLDIFRDIPVSPDRSLLAQALKTIPNIIGIEVALNQDEALNVKPPPELPSNRIGFADFILDFDSKLRRSLLASKTWEGQLKYSLALHLAKAYLSAEEIPFQHGTHSQDPIRFGSTKLPRFLTNSGGYVQADANGNQILLNFCSSSQPFRTLSLRDIYNRNFEPSWIRDRLVIIGMMASSIKDSFLSSAVKSTQVSSEFRNNSSSNQFIYGVEIHAHAASQIISAVLDKRPLLRAWSDIGEYLWIVLWGLLGVLLGPILQSPWKTFLSLGIASVALFGISYLLLIWGWWIPVVPTWLALCGAGLTTSFFDRDLRFELEQRRLTIERTYDAVHNGPLQHLAVLLRSTDDNNLSPTQLREQLQELNQELRSIYESMRQEVLTQSDSLYLQENLVLDLQTPIHELLYQVYDHTLDREFQGFTTIRTYIPPNFQPLENLRLTASQKRGLCLFLQEALCNVGKHAIGATRLDVICTEEAGQYHLRIIDNGVGITASANSSSENQGTKQAQELAKQLRGTFQRKSHSPQGTICELTWPVSRIWLTRFW